MKFNYTKVVGEHTYKAGFDADVIWSYVLVENPDNTILILYTTLDPIEEYKQVPHYNKKGEVVEWRPSKVTQQPIVEITVQEEIDAFLQYWNS